MRWRAASWPKNAEFPWAGRRSLTAAVPGIPSWVHHCYPVSKHGSGNRAFGGRGAIWRFNSFGVGRRGLGKQV